MMFPTVDRRFLAIFGASMLFHAALFAFMARPRQPLATVPATLLASIRLIEVSASGLVAAAPLLAPARVPQKARQTPDRVAQPSTPRAMQTAGPANVPAYTPLPAPTMASLPASAAPGEAAHPATPPQGELLDGYRQRLGDLFARHQEYPRIAAQRGWEGEVRLRLKVARKGNLLDVQLERSSGFDLLDRHALAMLEALASLPPLPDGLESNEVLVVVPINYKLRKTT